MRLLQLIAEQDVGLVDQNLKDTDPEGSRRRADKIGAVVSDFLKQKSDLDFYALDWDDDEGKQFLDLEFSMLAGLISDLILEKKNLHMLRSRYSCRFLSFGYDRQVHFCVKSDDEAGSLAKEGIVVEDVSDLLIESDFFDAL